MEIVIFVCQDMANSLLLQEWSVNVSMTIQQVAAIIVTYVCDQ